MEKNSVLITRQEGKQMVQINGQTFQVREWRLDPQELTIVFPAQDLVIQTETYVEQQRPAPLGPSNGGI